MKKLLQGIFLLPLLLILGTSLSNASLNPHPGQENADFFSLVSLTETPQTLPRTQISGIPKNTDHNQLPFELLIYEVEDEDVEETDSYAKYLNLLPPALLCSWQTIIGSVKEGYICDLENYPVSNLHPISFSVLYGVFRL